MAESTSTLVSDRQQTLRGPVRAYPAELMEAVRAGLARGERNVEIARSLGICRHLVASVRKKLKWELPVRNLPSEIWKPVAGFEDRYAVSNMGRVRRLKAGPGISAGKTTNGNHGGRGYLVASLGTGKGRCLRKCVHVLVAETFLGPRPIGQEVNHKNAVKTDNRVENLEYTTHQGNMRHAFEHKLMPPPPPRSFVKLTETQVCEIRAARDVTVTELARRFGVARGTIGFILSRKTWAHLP